MKTNRDNTNHCRRRVWQCAMIAMLCLLGAGPEIKAHEGPPFPIIVDKRAGPYLVSVWTDPDIGTGTFFVVLEPYSGDRLPDVTNVQVGVAPSSGRLEEEMYTAEPQRVRYGARYYTEVQFDKGEMWQVRVIIEGSEGGGELRSEVEATPDGTIGPIGLLLYSLPFVAIGILWFRAMMRRREVAVSSGLELSDELSGRSAPPLE